MAYKVFPFIACHESGLATVGFSTNACFLARVHRPAIVPDSDGNYRGESCISPGSFCHGVVALLPEQFVIIRDRVLMR